MLQGVWHVSEVEQARRRLFCVLTEAGNLVQGAYVAADAYKSHTDKLVTN